MLIKPITQLSIVQSLSKLPPLLSSLSSPVLLTASSSSLLVPEKQQYASISSFLESLRAGMNSSSNAAVVVELTLLQELASKLRARLHPSQIELCRTLTQEIIFSVEKMICTAKSSGAHDAQPTLSDSSGKLEFTEKEPKMLKRRKMGTKLIEHVSVSAVGEDEAPSDDGHSWRKYGQKDILGAKYPRAYYRCTHRKSQGCAAVKQVQRSDENPSVFDITYRGTHTCSHFLQQTRMRSGLHELQQSPLDKQIRLAQHHGFQINLKVKSDKSENSANQDPTYLNFPTTTINGKKPENDLFCFSSVLITPTTSGSNCLPCPPCEMSSQGDAELAEKISAATSAIDSPIMDVDFMLDYGEMDPVVHFDTSIFFAKEWAM